MSFVWTDYRNGGGKGHHDLTGREFLHASPRHLVPKGFRRVRYYGLLAGKAYRHKSRGRPKRASMRRRPPPRPDAAHNAEPTRGSTVFYSTKPRGAGGSNKN